MRAQQSHAGWEFLLIGGDAGLYKTLTAAIQAFGGIVTGAASVESARQFLERRKLDGVFVDMRVPGALELLFSIRRSGSNRNAIMIACAESGDQANPILRKAANFVVGTPLAAFEVKNILAASLPLIAAERLRYERFRVNLPVMLEIEDHHQTAVTANISRGGMAVRCPDALAPGASVQFVLELPAQPPIRGRGEVAWSNAGGEMGIKFHLASEDARKSLWTWMAQSRGQGPS